MKLLVVSQYFWPENFKINDLVDGLTARGHHVTVLTGTPQYPNREDFFEFYADPGAYDAYKGASIVRVPLARRGNGLLLALNYLSFVLSGSVLGVWRLRHITFDAILVFQMSPVTLAIPGIVMRALRQRPLALWVQDLWPESLQAVEAVTSPHLLRLFARLVRWIYNSSDLILAQSKSFIPKIAANRDNQAPILYLPNWAEAIYSGPTEPASEVPDARGAFTVMFAGNVGDAQDFPAILDAAERLRANSLVRWVIVGDGRAHDWVASEVERRGLRESFLLLGRFSNDRMPSFYRCADALLVTLKRDPAMASTIPSKLQTYLAAGVPVIAMIDGEAATIVRESGAGLVCPAGDAQGLAAAVQTMAATDAELRREMGEAGKAFFASEFDRDTQIARLETMMSDLISERNRAR